MMIGSLAAPGGQVEHVLAQCGGHIKSSVFCRWRARGMGDRSYWILNPKSGVDASLLHICTPFSWWLLPYGTTWSVMGSKEGKPRDGEV